MTENSTRSASTDQWVEQLHSPRTRRLARQRLIAARAIEPLLECLNSPNESVVWAAIVSLGELQAAEAAEPLIALLERGLLEADVCGALAQITGQDYGTDADRWRKTLDTTQHKPSLDVAEGIAKTADYLGVAASGSGGSYVFKLSLDDDRSQKVAVFFDQQDAQQRELVVIYSECGPAASKYHEALLRKNLTMPFGAFAIRDIDGQANYVIVETMAASAVAPGILASKIEQIAAKADKVEKSLTQQDLR